MIAIVLLGAAFGIGALVAATAFGVAEPLGRAWARDEQDAEAASWLSLDDPTPLGVAGSLVARLVSVEPVSRLLDGSPFDQDLAVVGQDRVDFAAHVLVKAAITLGVGGFVAFFKPADSVATSRVVGVTILAALLVILLSVQSVQNQAKRRRVEILEAVTAFVEFTRLAAHTQSVEGAIRASARMGASWPFRRLETIIEQAALHRQPPWRGITALGHRYGMLDLIELGGALENAGTEGTRVQAMLAAKATSLRRRMTETEIAQATSATQRLSVPLGLLGVVLVAVLLAPAMLAF